MFEFGLLSIGSRHNPANIATTRNHRLFAVYYTGAARIAWSRVSDVTSSARFVVISHSHTTIGRQPSLSISSITRSSLALFRSNFARQNSKLDFGMLAMLHPWPCQKHPCTKSATLCRGNTMSGLPGRPVPPRRYLRPRACRDPRRITSGFVSFERILDILSDRSAAFKKSTISTLSKGWK